MPVYAAGVASWKSRAFRRPGVAGGTASAVVAAPEHSLQPDRRASTSPAAETVEQTVVERAIYLNGKRLENPHSFRAAVQRLAEPDSAMAWIGLSHATPEQIEHVAEIFHLHPLAVEDAIVAHQRPKLERYDDTLFVVLRPACYHDDTETVHLGELHMFVGPDFVVTVRHSDEPPLKPVRERMDRDPKLLAHGPEAVLYGVLDFVVDGYAPVIEGLENDIDEIEEQVFNSDPAVSRRIYELSREVLGLQRATGPLLGMLAALARGFEKYGTDEEIRRNLRDVNDHATSVVERVEGFRHTLADILTLNATLVAQTQNAEMTRLAETANAQSDQVKAASSWAAILFAPTVIAGIYGMNFTHMPELKWYWGYPMAVGLMVLTCITMWSVFKKKDWL